MSEPIVQIHGMAVVKDIKKYGLIKASELYANNWYKQPRCKRDEE